MRNAEKLFKKEQKWLYKTIFDLCAQHGQRTDYLSRVFCERKDSVRKRKMWEIKYKMVTTVFNERRKSENEDLKNSQTKTCAFLFLPAS